MDKGQTMETIKTVKEIVSAGKCAGCMACHHVCPSGAIDIQEGRDGFLYPNIQPAMCINCGICFKTCPSVGKRAEISNASCFAAQADDDTRFHSSSGGMFSVIAKHVLRQGGVVCGAGFVNGKVRHCIVDTEEGLDVLRKSKYIQSDCTGIYEQLQPHLHSGQPVLFTGTPCQCAAARAVYPETANLIVVDILCMGVPSQALFDRYLREEMAGSVENVDFRDKSKYGWTQNLVMAIRKNGSQQLIDNADSSYYCAFLDAYSIRESCTDCAFAGRERVGDLTIGDFWGIERMDPAISDKIGTSLLLVNTEKGRYILDCVRDELSLLREFPMEAAFRSNPILKYPTMVSSKRREFLEVAGDKSIREAYDELKTNKADCGIINYWWCDDNGAILTAFALQKLLQMNGYSSRLINICTGSQYERRSRGISSEFERKYLYTTEQITSKKQFQALNNSFTHFIAGSDQVFRAEWVSDTWFLDFAELSRNKIAMAASFGTGSLSVSRRRERKIKYLLRRFNSISIRELSGVRLCEKLGVQAQYVIDPVFLIEPQNYLDIVHNAPYSAGEKKHIFGYFRDPSEEKLAQIKGIAARYDLDVFIADDTTPVEQFLLMISSAEYVLTDSYHGLCFSLIFQKEYACYYNLLRGNDRFETLIEVLGINPKKFLPENENAAALVAVQCPENWDTVNRNILTQRENGVRFLMGALNNPPSINEKELKKAYWNEKLGNFGYVALDKLLYNRITRKLHAVLRWMKRKVKHGK